MSVLDRELFILPFRVSRYIVGLRTMDSQNCINKLVGFRRQPSFKLRVQQAKGKGWKELLVLDTPLFNGNIHKLSVGDGKGVYLEKRCA